MIKKFLEENHEEILSLDLEGLPPTVNHMYLSARNRRFRTKECKAYQDYVLNKIIALRTREWPYSGRMALTVVFTAPNKRRWDIDNRVKALQDCLALAGIIKDDCQIDFLLVRRVYEQTARTFLTLAKLENKKT